MGILDFLLGGQAQQGPFDPFGENEFADPVALPSQPPQAPAGGLIGGGVTPRPMSFGPAPAGSPVPNAASQPGFLTELFAPGSKRNAALLEANRQRFLPGGPLADVSPQQRQIMLQNPRNARRLIEAREAEARIRSRPLNAAQRKAESVRVEDLARERKRHESRVIALDDPTGIFKDIPESAKQALRGAPETLKRMTDEFLLAPGKARRAESLRPPRPFESAISKKRAERAAIREETILTAGATADQTLRSLDTIGGLLEQQRTGKLQPQRVAASEFLLDFGIDPSIIPLLDLPAEVGSAQALDAVTSAQRLVVLSAFKGNQTERELAFTKRVLPRLANTHLGNTLVLEVSRRIAKLDQIMRDALEEHILSEKPAAAFGKTRRRIQRENPVWTKSMRDKIKAARVGPSAVTEEQENAAKAQATRKGKVGTGRILKFNPKTRRLE